MNARIAATALGLMALLPGCITESAYTKMTAPIVDVEPTCPPADKISEVAGASVAVVEDRLQLVLETTCLDGKHRFWAAPIAGRDEEEPSPRAFARLDVAALPTTVAPIRFVADVDHFSGKNAAWWRERRVLAGPEEAAGPERPLALADLESAALVSVKRAGDGCWEVQASVPDQRPREIVKAEDGVLPMIDARDDAAIVLRGPKTPAPIRHEQANVAGSLAFLAVSPVTLTADVAVGALEVGGIALLVPLAVVTFPFWAHHLGC
jgi:hypothetical protein